MATGGSYLTNRPAGADAGDGYTAHELARLLAKRGDIEGLRARADTGDWYAAQRLARLLAERGDVDEAVQIARAWAGAGDGRAAHELVRLLAKHGDMEGLRAWADVGDVRAAHELAGILAELLIEQGHDEEAERLRRFGLNPDGSTASG